MNPIVLKEKLTNYRKWLRLSQHSVAEYLGLTKSAMSALESDLERKVELHELIKLCKLFHCSIDEILEFGNDFTLNTDIQFSGRMKVDDDLSINDKEELKFFVAELKKLKNKYSVNQYQAKSEVVKLAVKELLEICEIREAPIDVYKIANKLGIHVKLSALNKLSGAFVRGNPDERISGILLNSNQPERRNRFSLGHEIAHFFLGHYPDKDIEETKLGRHTLKTEKDADAFSSELLVPSSLLQSELDKLSTTSISEIEIYKLADHFIVSFQMMLNRLYYSEKVISDTQFKNYSKMKVRDIKKKASSVDNQKIEFSPQEHLKDVIGLGKRFDLKTIKKNDIRLLQEIAYEKYISLVPLEQRVTEVKDIYEQTIFWLVNAQTSEVSKNSVKSDPKEYLESKGYEVYDKRPNGGCLWVVDSEAVTKEMESLIERGFNFVKTENGSRTTKKRPSWYLKD